MVAEAIFIRSVFLFFIISAFIGTKDTLISRHKKVNIFNKIKVCFFYFAVAIFIVSLCHLDSEGNTALIISAVSGIYVFAFAKINNLLEE